MNIDTVPGETGGDALTSRWRGILYSTSFHVLIIVILGLAVYSNTFHVPFHFDDETSIVRNRVIKFLPQFLSGAGYDYNPRRFVGYLTFALNYKLGGLNVVGYHVFNLAVHIATALLVYTLARLTIQVQGLRFEVQNLQFKTQNSKLKISAPHPSLVPLLAALLFVSHPVQTQAVTYIVQRLASLATMFYLLSLVLYVRTRLFREQGNGGWKPWGCYLLSLASALVAMKTKEMAFTLPVMVLIYEFSFFSGKVGKRLLFLLPMLLTLAIVPMSMTNGGGGVPAGEILSDLSENARASVVISRGDYLLTQFRVIVTYIRLLFLPVNQNLDYDYPLYTCFLAPPVFLSFIFLLALFGLAIYLYYRSTFNVQRSTFETQNSKLETFNSQSASLRLIAFGILWFFITLSVESSVVPIADVIFEHRLYLPTVGPFMAFAAVVAFLAGRVPAKAAAAVIPAMFVALSAAAWKRNAVWQEPLTLWEDSVYKSPGKVRPRYNLGNALNGKGFKERAIEEYQIALSIMPGYTNAWNNLGAVLLEKGETDRAIVHFSMALKSMPDQADVYYNLGDAYRGKGETGKAIENYRKALALKPDYSEAHNHLGIALAQGGDMEKAVEHFRAAVACNPDNMSARNNLARATGK